MEKKDKIPDRLFKYRQFNNQTLDMVISDQIFFADPITFNDPLDTKPSLKVDIDSGPLESIFAQLVQKRESDEMTAAAKRIGYRGPKTRNYISRNSQRYVDQLLEDIRYNATNPEHEENGIDDPYRMLLGQHVEAELLRRYQKGVFSLAERADCPLMWSHYGDQHKGICIGYSVPVEATPNAHKMKYGGSRLVEASNVSAMLKGNKVANQKVDQAVLLKKAQDWRYEKEWRVIGNRGLQDSTLELEEVIFGMRCDNSVKYTVVKALEKRERLVKFYEIRQKTHDGFLLKKYTLDTEELTAHFPRRALSIYEALSHIETE